MKASKPMAIKTDKKKKKGNKIKAGRYTWHIYFAIVSTFTCLPCGFMKAWPSGSG